MGGEHAECMHEDGCPPRALTEVAAMMCNVTLQWARLG